MCIAILNKPNQTLRRKHLKNCWNNNDDGAGMSWVSKKGNINIFKELNSFDVFYQKYISVRKHNPESNMLLHFRIKTHGKTDKTNCHPFKVSNELAFCHNGVIRDVEDHDHYSDTIMFNRTILRQLPKSFIYNKATLTLIEEFIGSGNKLIFLTNKNEAIIINESVGEHTKKGWFSNDSWKRTNDYVWAGSRKISRNQRGGYYGGYYDMYDDDYLEMNDWNESYGVNDEVQKEVEKDKVFSLQEIDDSPNLDGTYDNCIIDGCSSRLLTEDETRLGICKSCEDIILQLTEDYNLFQQSDYYKVTYRYMGYKEKREFLVKYHDMINIYEELEMKIPGHSIVTIQPTDVWNEYKMRKMEKSGIVIVGRGHNHDHISKESKSTVTSNQLNLDLGSGKITKNS